MTTLSVQPWYRQLWPWLLMIAPAAAVLGGVATLWLSLISDDGLVADDYYKHGMAINRTLTREKLAHEFAYRAEVGFYAQRSAISVQLSSERGAALPEMLRLRIVHPTRAGSDQNLALKPRAPGVYVGAAQLPAQGVRTLILEDAAQTWRLTGPIDPARGSHAVLIAKP